MMTSGDAKSPGESEGPSDRIHVLTFDVEEYFQVEAAAEGGVAPGQWQGFPRRLGPCVDTILDLLGRHQATATFFVLGWVAREEGDIVRRIAAARHEVASHGMDHAMLTRLTPQQFRAQLLDSRKLLEDLSGAGVTGYRAPTFSLTQPTAWALDVLAEAGYRYDSSIFPVRHDRYGIRGAPRRPHRAKGPGGGEVVELPPLTLRVAGVNLPVAGGGYLRLLPAWVVSLALKRAARAGSPGVLYLHPWEFDPDQPVLPMSRLSRWRHRVNLHRTAGKLHRLLERFRFQSAGEFLKTWDASSAQVHSYG